MDELTDQQRVSVYAKALLASRSNRAVGSLFAECPPPLQPSTAGRRASRRTLQSLELFTGAGGLTLGLHAAGFRPSLAVELDADACQTLTAALPAVPVDPKPVASFDFRRFEGIDLVAGGPPCQPFSSGGKQLAGDDARDLIPEFIRAVTEARPRAFLMENVSALFGSTHSAYLARVIKRLSSLGYTVAMEVLNAAEYGVPQKRRRGFLIGLRNGHSFAFPAPTHGPRGELPFVSAGTVLRAEGAGDEPNEAKVSYARNPDLRPSPYDGQLFNGGGRPINLSAPSHTILASAGGTKTHFIDTAGEVPGYHAHLMRGGPPRTGTLPGGRRLTPVECAAIQTFPPGMVFHGSRSAQYKQIGNAVPPRLAQVIGAALHAALS
jgi:DNA (cytosine-5)-methyltransferase 1